MSIKTLLLAGVLSLTAASAAYAMEGPPTGVGSGNGHASAAPACGYECPVLAGDTGPGGPGDNNGRAELSTDSHQMLAGEGPPTTAGDHNGRSNAALSQGGGEFRVAGGRPSMSGEV